jgi:hypothetical protein
MAAAYRPDPGLKLFRSASAHFVECALSLEQIANKFMPLGSIVTHEWCDVTGRPPSGHGCADGDTRTFGLNWFDPREHFSAEELRALAGAADAPSRPRPRSRSRSSRSSRPTSARSSAPSTWPRADAAAASFSASGSSPPRPALEPLDPSKGEDTGFYPE